MLNFLKRFFQPNLSGYESSTGTIVDLEGHIQRVMRSSPEAFVIVEVNPEGDFVQFQGDSKGIRLDFPQSTARQRALKGSVLASLCSLHLELIENKGSDGTVFLDCDINGDSGYISSTLTKFLAYVFQVSEASPLKFTGYALAP